MRRLPGSYRLEYGGQFEAQQQATSRLGILAALAIVVVFLLLWKCLDSWMAAFQVLLRDLHFSDAYAAAIEQKQIAQQNAQRMQYVLLKAEQEKKQKILEAQGDARSIALRGHAIAQNARVVQYEYARKIAPNVSTIITDGRSLPFSSPQPTPGR